MTATPKLPPLPYPQMPGNDYTASDMQAYALAAYQAGRDAALEEAVQICDERALASEAAVSDDEPDETASLHAAAWKLSVCARRIRALKGAAPSSP